MSAALENVPRGDEDVAEVTNLAGAVRAWAQLDHVHQDAAVLTVEHAIQIDGAATHSFAGDGIAAFAKLLPSSSEVQ
jgi:hypothetical protein